ncbi:MAG TPA: hypothetical protein VFF02_06070 [Anaeromyxobacteraceae bacterium]|nr:hypothetical protein [Anaeromyxobacteraceae bacterium]
MRTWLHEPVRHPALLEGPLQVSVQQVAALLARVEEGGEDEPEQAREAQGAIVRSLTLTPAPEGYRATLAFQNSAAPLVNQGGRFDVQSCGGVPWSKADLLTFASDLSCGKGI